MSNKITESMRDKMKASLWAALNMGGLAGKIGAAQGTIAHMKKRGMVLADWVIAVEKATGISRYDLRPDLYTQDEREAIVKKSVAVAAVDDAVKVTMSGKPVDADKIVSKHQRKDKI